MTRHDIPLRIRLAALMQILGLVPLLLLKAFFGRARYQAWFERTLSMAPDVCVVDWWGTAIEFSPQDPSHQGWHLVRATHRITGRTWYGYHRVWRSEQGERCELQLGFALKPVHVHTACRLRGVRLPFVLHSLRSTFPQE